MFYTDNPVADWDSYMRERERKNKEWHEENDWKIENDIFELQCKIEDLQYDLKNEKNEDKKYEIECDIEELQHDIKKLKEKLEED